VAAWLDRLPDGLRRRLFGLAVWQWVGLLLATAIGPGIMLALYWISGIRSEMLRETSLLRYWGTMWYATVAVLIPLAFKHFIWNFLTIRGTALYVAEFSANLAFLLGLIVVIIAVSCRLADSVVALPKRRLRTLDATLVRILFRTLGIVAAVIVFLEGGRYLGFPLTTLLASAGIGGLAIALSAQGMVKGLFGTVTILLDRPYRVGERIAVNGHDGVVEEIGLRSTKIREFSNHLISIPNDQMADAKIENIGKRKFIRRVSDLQIPIDTPREQVEKALGAIRAILQDHEGMDPEYPPRVYFTEFNPDSFNVHVIYWYTPPELWSYYAFCEKVNLQICQAFEEHGIQFSLPLRHSYWKHDDEQGPLEVKFLGNGDSAKTPPFSSDPGSE
jgi:MscS family membrane protein